MSDALARVQAAYRPRTNDIRIIRRDGEAFDIPAEDAIDLAAAIGAAMSVPSLAEAMAAQDCGSAH